MNKIIRTVLILSMTTFLWADLNVTIDVTGLSSPRENLNQIEIPGFVQPFHGNKAVVLNDGEYDVVNRYGGRIIGSYGKFTISGSDISVVDGALTKVNDSTIGFDTTQLTRVTMDSRDLEIRLDGGTVTGTMFTIAGVTNTLRFDFSVYLPNGEDYHVYTRAGVMYGSFDVNNGSVSRVTGALKIDNEDANFIRFDREKLTPIRLDEGALSLPERHMMSAIYEVTGYFTYKSIFFVPAGVHNVGTRWSGGIFGQIIIDENGNITTEGSPVVLGTNVSDEGIEYFEIGHDVSKLNSADFFFGELSSSELFWAPELYQTAGGASQHHVTRFYLPLRMMNGNSVSFKVTKYDGYKHFTYGEVTTDSTGLSVSGALYLEGNEVHFDTCELMKVTFTPAEGELFHMYRWLNSVADEEVSFFVPVGTSFPVTVARNGIDQENRFKVTVADTGLVIEEGVNDGRLSITLEEGHCTPPDSDLDGVVDELDECPDTYETATVNMYGCSPEQEIKRVEREEFKNHGQYVRYIAHMLNDMVEDGLITDAEKDELMSESAQK